MWTKLLEFIKKVVALTGDFERSKAEIKELRTDITRLTFLVQELSHQIDLLRQAREHDREQVDLKIENQALRIQESSPS